MIQQEFMTWSNWNWSKEYNPFRPTDNHLQSKVQVIWSKEYRVLTQITVKCIFKREVKISENNLLIEMVYPSHLYTFKIISW